MITGCLPRYWPLSPLSSTLVSLHNFHFQQHMHCHREDCHHRLDGYSVHVCNSADKVYTKRRSNQQSQITPQAMSSKWYSDSRCRCWDCLKLKMKIKMWMKYTEKRTKYTVWKSLTDVILIRRTHFNLVMLPSLKRNCLKPALSDAFKRCNFCMVCMPGDRLCDRWPNYSVKGRKFWEESLQNCLLCLLFCDDSTGILVKNNITVTSVKYA